MYTVQPTQENIFSCLTNFLSTILVPAVEIVQGQDNRVPEPQANDFVVMTPIRRDRLSTNVDSSFDAQFTASITGSVMTVTAIQIGALVVTNLVWGTGVLNGTVIVNQLSGSVGGIGTYTVTGTQTVSSSTMAAGNTQLLAAHQATMQLDVHGPNSSDNAAAIVIAFRDEFGYNNFTAQCVTLGIPSDSVVPIHADDPRQVPFVNDQNQYENRWIVEAVLQVNESLYVPQQYATTVQTGLLEVDTTFPG